MCTTSIIFDDLGTTWWVYRHLVGDRAWECIAFTALGEGFIWFIWFSCDILTLLSHPNYSVWLFWRINCHVSEKSVVTAFIEIDSQTIYLLTKIPNCNAFIWMNSQFEYVCNEMYSCHISNSAFCFCRGRLCFSRHQIFFLHLTFLTDRSLFIFGHNRALQGHHVDSNTAADTPTLMFSSADVQQQDFKIWELKFLFELGRLFFVWMTPTNKSRRGLIKLFWCVIWVNGTNVQPIKLKPTI